MAAGYGLESVPDVLLVSYFDDVIDDEEFTLLYEENYSRGIFPYCMTNSIWMIGMKRNVKSS